MGNTLQAWSNQFVPNRPLVGEARAAWNAIKLPASKGYENIILEGDAWNVIENIILERDAWNVIEPLRNANVDPHWSNKILCDDTCIL